MKIKDFQFINYFLQTEIDLDIDFNKEVRIVEDKLEDIVTSNSCFTIHSPKHIGKVLFNLVYQLCNEQISNAYKKDVFSLVLNQAINEYLYRDFVHIEETPPVILSGSKFIVPTLIISELVEPLADRHVELLPVLSADCPVTDVCRIIESSKDLSCLSIEHRSIPYTKYPLILCNHNIYNKPATQVHLLIRQLEESLGEQASQKLVRKILLDPDDVVLDYLIQILYLTEKCPFFVDDFISYLRSYAELSKDESETFVQIIKLQYGKNKKLSKFAQYYDPQIQRQWTQWAVLLGLTEKQLESVRGGSRPTTELMKSIDSTRKKLKDKKRRANRKTTLNMEELLETYRELYDDHATEPGKLYETLLGKNRIW